MRRATGGTRLEPLCFLRRNRSEDGGGKKKKKAAASLEINNIIKDNEVRESSEGLRHDTYRDTVATIRYIVK